MTLFLIYLEKLLDLLFPICCIICGKKGPDLCDECIINFKWPKPRKRNVRWITSLWNYRDPNVEKLMRHIKSLPNARAANLIAGLFSERILNRPVDPTSWMIIPVPIARKRFRERGYNQAELLAKPLAAAFGFAYSENILVKTKHTKKQGTSKSREDRMKNVVGAFSVRNPESISGKNLVLIDDITTTGSTLSEARKILLGAGAARVIAWTVAN